MRSPPAGTPIVNMQGALSDGSTLPSVSRNRPYVCTKCLGGGLAEVYLVKQQGAQSDQQQIAKLWRLGRHGAGRTGYRELFVWAQLESLARSTAVFVRLHQWYNWNEYIVMIGEYSVGQTLIEFNPTSVPGNSNPDGGQLFAWFAFELCHALFLASTQLQFSHNDLHVTGNLHVYSSRPVALAFGNRRFQSRQAVCFRPKIFDFDKSAADGMEWKQGVATRIDDRGSIHTNLGVLKRKFMSSFPVQDAKFAACAASMLQQLEADGFSEALLNHELFSQL